MTVIIDYGVGNLFSLTSSLKVLGADVVVSGDKEVIRSADKIILPGVGAFGDASDKLFSSGLADIVIERANAGVPLLGICLGMQMLFDKSFEYGEHKGLGLIKGEIRPIADVVGDLKVPHMGWNSLEFTNGKSEIFKYLEDGDFVYFVHSYYAKVEKDKNLIATTDYTAKLTASVQSGKIYGCQFHPEKSGEVGLKILKAFSELE
jgi:glutamine amidotransferase